MLFLSNNRFKNAKKIGKKYSYVYLYILHAQSVQNDKKRFSERLILIPISVFLYRLHKRSVFVETTF
jgi:hypothetical protein